MHVDSEQPKTSVSKLAACARAAEHTAAVATAVQAILLCSSTREYAWCPLRGAALPADQCWFGWAGAFDVC